MDVSSNSSRKLIFINSHPIQYFAPLYKFLNEHDLPTECWYCSDENVKGHLDRQFGTQVAWDVPLLEGYAYRFFRNRSWRPSLYNGFFGLINPGMISALFKEPKSIIVVHGWSYATHVLVLFFARIAGHTVCLRGESPLNQELVKSKINLLVKTILLRCFIFRFVHAFLFIGSQNKAFYKYYGVKESRLVFVPYVVDNERFQKAAKELLPKKNELRSSLGLPVASKVILFAAKFTEKKRPLDLLNAFAKLSGADKCLVMVGDGELKPEVERVAKEKSLSNVYLAGFVNQKDISKYYAVADAFVLCSGVGETWGLSANEVLNFGVPLVISDTAGCSFDLVQVGKNGYVSKTGDIDDLQVQINNALELTTADRSILDQYSFDTIANSLRRVAINISEPTR